MYFWKTTIFLLKSFECPFVLMWYLYFSFNNVLCQKRFESRTLHWLQVLYKNMSFTQNPCNKVPRFFKLQHCVGPNGHVIYCNNWDSSPQDLYDMTLAVRNQVTCIISNDKCWEDLAPNQHKSQVLFYKKKTPEDQKSRPYDFIRGTLGTPDTTT